MPDEKKPETTMDGVLEALLSGEVTAESLIQEMEQHPELLEDEAADKAMANFKKMAKAGKMPVGKKDDKKEPEKKEGEDEEKEEAKEPEPKPVGALVPEPAPILTTFESIVGERCGFKYRKKPKAKKKESLEEFSMPERQDVMLWARGQAPKRTEGIHPFFFRENTMFSRGQKLAVRQIKEKTAQIVHPRYLDNISGRHAMLASQGLRSCGYTVELVDKL